ncbi:MAG: AMP-binding protein [Bacteroidetes bacterium]|jgi:fatty-acyl-CoA synthase|nr:AMP-binding protein [Bacteroidota bacterium]
MKLISYEHGTSEIPLLGETIPRNLLNTVKKFPDKEALIVKHQHYRATYETFYNQVCQVAKALMAHGAGLRTYTALWSPNRYEWVLVQYATAMIGSILVTINPGYKTKDLTYALNQSDADILIASEGFRNTSYVEIINKVKPDLQKDIQIFILENDWDQFLKEGNRISDATLAGQTEKLQFDQPINIQYTSGTTSLPKGVVLTHHNILNNGYFIGQRLGYHENHRVCIPVPFYHCFGMVLGNLACTTHGSCMVIPYEYFDAGQVLKTVEEEKCTSLYGVPTMFIAELDEMKNNTYNLSSLSTGIMAGAPCPIEVMKKVQKHMHMEKITVCYGMTETSPVSTQTMTDDPLDKRVSTVGKVHPHVEIKIIDPQTNNIVPRGEEGEICTRGYSVMMGYYNDDFETDNVIDKGRWMHTGDLGCMDEEGYVAVTGRIKDMILRGGENISPREIEEYLLQHDEVMDAQVIGIPSEKYGEEPMAWIKTKPGSTLNDQTLTEFCKGEIATYKIPKCWKFVDEFPMTVTGKIRKVEMREIAAKELGLNTPINTKTA